MLHHARVRLAAVVLWALAISASAEDVVDFRPAAPFLKLPEGMTLGPCSGVNIDSRDNIYVIQRKSPPILCFDSSGKFLRGWGTELIGRDPEMQGAHGIRVDKDDFVWITDRERHLVRKFDPSGQLLLTLGTERSPGTGQNQFNRPADVAFGPTGEVYVADGYGNSRVMKLDASCHHSQRQSDPIGIPLSNRVEHQRPQDAIRNKRIKELPRRFAEIRIRVLTDGLIPRRFGHFQLAGSCVSAHIVSPPDAVYLKNANRVLG